MSTTRRSFLSNLAFASAAPTVMCPPTLQAAALAPISFAVVTDTHLGKNDSEASERLWAKTAAELQAAPGAFVLHLGDIVDGQREAQYPRYLAARAAIAKPIHEIPGNHDNPEDFQKHFREQIDTFFDHEWLRVVLMNNSKTTSHDGFFEEKQLDWLSRVCDDAAEKKRRMLICTHVPVHSNTHPDRGWYVKPTNGQTAFYQTIKQHASRILALFHGHFHNGLRGWDDHAPVHEILFPSALYNQDRNLEEQKAPGYNPREFRAGYTLVNIENGVMRLQYRATGAAGGIEKALPLLSDR
jgi:predicted MPP superfamily phosphohydrolase